LPKKTILNDLFCGAINLDLLREWILIDEGFSIIGCNFLQFRPKYALIDASLEFFQTIHMLWLILQKVQVSAVPLVAEEEFFISKG